MKKLLIAVPLVLLLLLGLLLAGLATRIIGGGPPSQGAMRDIPPDYMPLYQTAADTCPGLPWPVLAAIGKVESNHGRSSAPGVTFGENFAGAAGPMQFGIGGKAGNTWGGSAVHQVPPQVGYGTDGDGDGVASVYQPADAIFGAARYLCANGALRGADIPRAIFAYNHADWYVTKVLAIASSYAAGPGVALPAGPAVETPGWPSAPTSRAGCRCCGPHARSGTPAHGCSTPTTCNLVTWSSSPTTWPTRRPSTTSASTSAPAT